MQPEARRRCALVFGGTGLVGSAVVRELARRGIAVTFTYLSAADKARELAAALGCRAVRVDLGDAAATTSFFTELAAAEFYPDVFIHCAAVSRLLPLPEITLEVWQRTMAVNAQSAFLTCQWLADRMPAGSNIVLVGALDRTQSLPLPVHFAATQGTLSAMVMALAHELGPRGICVNMVALGILDGGLSRELDHKRRQDYEAFSALRRTGEAAEAARTIVWLALANQYMSGKVVAASGGI